MHPEIPGGSLSDGAPLSRRSMLPSRQVASE